MGWRPRGKTAVPKRHGEGVLLAVFPGYQDRRLPKLVLAARGESLRLVQVPRVQVLPGGRGEQHTGTTGTPGAAAVDAAADVLAANTGRVRLPHRDRRRALALHQKRRVRGTVLVRPGCPASTADERRTTASTHGRTPASSFGGVRSRLNLEAQLSRPTRAPTAASSICHPAGPAESTLI